MIKVFTSHRKREGSGKGIDLSGGKWRGLVNGIHHLHEKGRGLAKEFTSYKKKREGSGKYRRL